MMPSSKLAIYSGYELSIPNFKQFILSLQTPLVSVIRNDPDSDLWDYMTRGDITLLRRFCFVSEEAEMAFDGDLEEKLKHLFPPIRFVPYKGENQLEESHPDSKIIREETEKDKAALAQFIQYVRSIGGQLNASMVNFGYMKDIHPSLDTKNPYSSNIWCASTTMPRPR
ncbi:hypothetical protein AMATHDRAFT_50405 [Amanita thiersii Skay4041]|uniref:Uncharacterized protein n=1 Tax=Amanita thiersii Skay4041 TaxID=703135 RepID=A0A2A9NI05_9AGAR|nr:hypothetical protein AMATHDRAFT_50405 [Amanita thiersii Skay4041]